MKLNCIAIDDEKLILDLLVDNISRVPFLHLLGSFKNALAAQELISEGKVDLLFLDIQMPGITGLSFIQSLPQPPMVIFVTAYEKYALEGFNVNAIDYLLKPVSFERFLKACNKALEQFRLQQHTPTPKAAQDYFFVYVEYNQVRVNKADISYLEGMKDYVKIHLLGKQHPLITRATLKTMEDKLGTGFIRIHRSYIVPVAKITAVKRDLVCIGEEELPLSEHYRAALQQVLDS